MVNIMRSTHANIAVSSAIGLLHVQLKLKKEISFIYFNYVIGRGKNIFLRENLFVGLNSYLPASKVAKCSVLYQTTWITNSSVN